MPVFNIMLVVDGLWGSPTSTTTVVSPVTSTTSGTTVWFNNAATTGTTCSSNIVWVNMSTPVFDTYNAHNYQQLIAQQAMQAQLLNATPGQVPNTYQQQLPNHEQLVRSREHYERRLREDHEAARQAARNREAARNRARDLLLDHLTPEQRETMKRHGWFVVLGGKSKQPYRIHTDRGPAGNVIECDYAGAPVARLCGHIRTAFLPDYDEYLAQMIMLQADEDAYRALANRSQL